MHHDESMNPARHEASRASHAEGSNGVVLPVPTPWPMVLALGITLVIAGMVTHWVISLLGLVLLLRSMVGWFFEVLPHEHHASVPIHASEITISSQRRTREKLAAEPNHRKILPVETFSVMAGIKGGIAGGIAMIIPASLFGLIRFHSVWYAVNLLAAGGFIGWAGESNAFLAQFHLLGLLAAFGIHAVTSLLVGLLYGAMLPMFPRKPILTAGFIAPRIDWLWFVISQIAFGLVCGFVVNLQVKVRTPQFRALPFAVRAGLHSDQTPANPSLLKDPSTLEEKDQ